MSVTREERIKAEAYSRWEKEGRPAGEHERHWHEAAEAVGMPDAAYELESEGTTQALEPPALKPKRARAKKASAG